VRCCSVRVPIRPLQLPIGLPFLGTEAAYELFNDMAIAPSSDITPNMLTVIPLPIGTVAFAGVPLLNDRFLTYNTLLAIGYGLHLFLSSTLFFCGSVARYAFLASGSFSRFFNVGLHSKKRVY
jgi:hypothetical protein